MIGSQLREFTRLESDGKFYTASEYPQDAWYEAVVTACVHRSYNLKNMNIFVKMFDDRLVVESPGGFPPLVTPENIYDMHAPRNPHLMNAMFYLKFVKCAHEGTRRIRDKMKEMDLPLPEFVEIQDTAPLVHVTLRNNISQRKAYVDSDAAKKIGKALFQTLHANERRIINFVAENKSINVSQALRLNSSNWPASKRLLVSLVDKGILDYVRRGDVNLDTKAYFVLRGSRDDNDAVTAEK